jgi:chromosome segregation ATPase
VQALRFEEWDHRLESTIEACLHSLTELTQRVEAGVDDDVIRQLASRINVCERRLNGKSVSHESDESNLHPESDPELEPEPELDSDFLSKMGSMLAAVNGLSNRLDGSITALPTGLEAKVSSSEEAVAAQPVAAAQKAEAMEDKFREVGDKVEDIEGKVADIGSKMEDQSLQVDMFEDKVNDLDANLLMVRMKMEDAITTLRGRVLTLEQTLRQKLQDDIFTQLDADGASKAARGPP